MWYRGIGENNSLRIATFIMHMKVYKNGPAYSGQEKINFDGSLLLENVTLNDTGHYTVVIYLQNSKKEIATGQLLVYRE